MPWMEKGVKLLREEFINKCLRSDRNFSALCDEYKISRKTGYKWLKRYQDGIGLNDQDRRPHQVNTRTAREIEQLILDVRDKYPGWGARKIRAHLCAKGHIIPCIRTVNNILSRNGAISLEVSLARRQFKRFEMASNNELWQADFKGDVLMNDGNKCYPLAILDDHSRYALLLEPKLDQRDVLSSFIPVFREFGLPNALLTDNGPCFAGSRKGYCLLERALMDQDVLPMHGRYYHPQTQGKIERFHRAMKNEVLKFQYFADIDDAVRRLSEWKTLYNNERPHQALGDRCPYQVYIPSQRYYKEKVLPYEYNSAHRVYKINNWGFLRFAHHQLFVSETFRDTFVQLVPDDSMEVVQVCYRNYSIAKFDVATGDLISRTPYRLSPLV